MVIDHPGISCNALLSCCESLGLLQATMLFPKPSKPSKLGGLVSIRFSRKGAQWCQALGRLDCLGYRAAPDVVSFNCGISACGQVGFKSSPSK